MDVVNVAVVGAGFFGEFHARAYSENRNARLVAVVDVDAERARRVAEKYGAEKWFESIYDMLDGCEVDAVSIATPEQHHREPAVAAAKAGKDIFVEKPLAHSLEDGEAIVQEARANGVHLMVGFIMRFDPRYAQGKERVERGEVGEVTSIWGRRITNRVTPSRVAGWSHPLFYVGIHDIDMMRWYVEDEAAEVYGAISSKVFAKVNAPDVVMGIIKFRNGAVGGLEINWALPTTWTRLLESRLHVVGTKGAVFVDVVDMGLEVYSEAGAEYLDTVHWPVVRGRLVGALREEIGHFIECVAEDREPLVTGEDGLRSLEIALALIKSSKEGRPVALPLQR
jgi:predicted dehydrogenase